MAFFHGVVLERRHFGSMGWNERADFNKTDLEVSMHQLKEIFFLTPRDEKDEVFEMAELGATLEAIRYSLASLFSFKVKAIYLEVN